jgi:hypothetical protein
MEGDMSMTDEKESSVVRTQLGWTVSVTFDSKERADRTYDMIKSGGHWHTMSQRMMMPVSDVMSIISELTNGHNAASMHELKKRLVQLYSPDTKLSETDAEFYKERRTIITLLEAMAKGAIYKDHKHDIILNKAAALLREGMPKEKS